MTAISLSFAFAPALEADDHVDYVADITQYKNEPFLKFIPSVPQVMIVLERDWKIFYPAYNNTADLNGDGSIDNGFNPTIAYVGYFDVDSCYGHDGTKFYRAEATTPQTQEDVDALRPPGLKSTIPSPASNHGVCPGTSSNGQGQARWAGNWLNYVVTSRMDAIRKVLYGGKRRTDSATQTILEPSYVPSNGLAWGAEVVSDALWNEYAPDSPWFPAELYIGLPRPAARYMHFFARADHAAYSNHEPRNAVPLLKILANVDSTYPHPISKTKLRYWDWAYGPAIVPDDNNMPRAVGGYTAPTRINLPAIVEACRPGSISPTEGCWLYGSVYKPTGLMQQYGERGNMQFGLITSTITRSGCTNSDIGAYADFRCNDKGGVLRHHIERLPGSAINSGTGQFVAGGIIKTIDKFEITDYLDMMYPYNGTLVGNIPELRFPYGTNTGNPVGEMAMEALRYLGGATAGLPAYAAPGAELLGLTTANWSRRPVDPLASCVKPFVLLISAIYPTFDGDQFPTAAQLPHNRLTQLNGSEVPQAWSVPAFLELITKVEGYREDGRQYYYPKTSHAMTVRGLCTPKPFDAGMSLHNISGFCPSEPSLAGSYSLAAAAYYGHTHDFSADGRNMPVDFFVVGLSPSVPHVSISDGRGHTADIVPTVILGPGYGYQLTGDSNFYYITQDGLPPARTMFSFIMKRVQADANGVNFRMQFLTNFESAAEPNEIFERDHINNAEVALVTNSSTPARYREALPYYINSGPLKTTYSIASACSGANAIPADQPSHLACANVPAGHKAYYAFKNPDDPADRLDVTEWDVEGLVVVSNSTGSDTGWHAAVGYGISGVIYPGVYMDVANSGHDNRRTPSSQAYPYAKTGQTKLGVPNGFWYPNSVRDKLLTPWDCPYADYAGPNAASLCGRGSNVAFSSGNINGYPSTLGYSFDVSGYYFSNVSNKMAYIQIRSFKFDEDVTAQPKHLPNPLWLAAKYGGFKDADKDGIPDTGEWDSIRAGVPDNYFEVANLSELPGQLSRAFDRISKAGEAVTATSDSITSVLGGGLAIQTSYVPEYTSAKDNDLIDEKKVKIKWVGNAFSFFIDQWGNLREDSNENGKLDIVNGPGAIGGGDKVVRFSNQIESDNARISLWADELGTNDLEEVGTVPTLYGLKSVWDTNKLLSSIPSESVANVRGWGSISVGRRLYAYVAPPSEPGAGFASPVRLSQHLFSLDNAESLAPIVAQGYTLGSPRKFLGPQICDEARSKMCGGEHVPCQELHVSAVGRAPHDKSSIRVELSTAVPAGEVIATTVTGNVLLIKVGLTSAKGIVTALNDYIFDSHVAHVVRAHLNSGDTGDWTPDLAKASSITLPTTYTQAERLETTKELIRYVYGEDIRGWRSRTVCTPSSDAEKKTWRLGDVVNSKPVIVAEPSGGYDLLYGDVTYSNFKKRTSSGKGARGRRIVAYLGSNDGILHAINLGFYGSLADGTIGYQTSPFTEESGQQHKLGTELWGYIPTSVLPHLTWAADPSYAHSYYVDLEPMIVDIKNTTGQTKSMGGGQATWADGEWRTILIGGLRLGGRTIELDNPDAPVKYLHSEYFALDVTNPEEEPVLLWRFTHPDLGLTVSKPAVVSSVDGWHVLVGSGPTTDLPTTYTDSQGNVVSTKKPLGNGGELAYNGVSNQKAKVFVINAYDGKLETVLGGESDDNMPQGHSVPANSFFNDSFVVAAAGPGSSKLIARGSTPGSVEWRNPSVYFGLTESRSLDRLDRGAVYRVRMVNDIGEAVGYEDWKLTTMYKTDRPVTGAVNATFDPLSNLWVVFGTGRLWSDDDRSPMCSLAGTAAQNAACEVNHTHYLYGLKEPMENGFLTYAEIKETSEKRIADVTKAKVYQDGVVQDYDNLPMDTTYNDVLKRMQNDAGYLGYKRGLNIWAYTNSTHSFDQRTYEMVITQPKIDAIPGGSNLVVSTYQPSSNLCDPEGHSYLYLYETYTGIPNPNTYFYNFSLPTNPFSRTVNTSQGTQTYEQISGYLDAGKGQATEAWIIKGTDSTIYGNTSANQVQNRIVLETALGGYTTGTLWWREVLDMGLSLDYDDLIRGLPGAPD